MFALLVFAPSIKPHRLFLAFPLELNRQPVDNNPLGGTLS